MLTSTALGTFEGRERDGIVQFRGIRYATARRFEAPEAVQPHHGVAPAVAFGAIAPQNPSPLESMLGAGAMASGEDCLHLNVFTPGIDDRARPVLVWIHGGGFTAGTGATPWYAGDRLARRGDAVVVTINYRLGALGFMAVDGFADAANNGIADQIEALRWVRDHIAAFGGDPGNVTIFGESAGAMSVGTLLGNPRARGLFHRAICQSGAADNVHSPDESALVAEAFCRHAGVPSGDAEGLLALPIATILAAQQATQAELTGSAVLLPFQPTVDGTTIARHPRDAVADGSAAGVDLLIGTTAQEWRLFGLTEAMQGGPTQDQALRRIGRAAGADRVDAALDAYRATRGDATAAQVWEAVATDVIFRMPALRLADAHQRHGTTRAYWFTYPSTAFDGALGSCHALDVPFTFDNVHRRGVEAFTGPIGPDGVRLAAAMSAAWLDFARTGDPDGEVSEAAAQQGAVRPPWPRYDPTARRFAELGRQLRTIEDPDPVVTSFWLG